MIILLLVLCIVMIVIGLILYEFDILENLAIGLGVFGVIGGIIALIATLVLTYNVSCLGSLDETIQMYEEENTKIETQIAIAIESYQNHEAEVFTNVAPDLAMTLISLYSELKSDTLVAAQIDTYLKNNAEIKSLKESLIKGDVLRWWLYFGG